MSGHSRWSQIKYKKSLTDQKRGQVFSKFSKNITLAARKGVDLKNNTALANAVEQARRENMPNDNIERAIKKASEKDGTQLEEIMVEAIWAGARLRQGFGGQGVALKIQGVTDNKNRAISEIKKVLSNHEAKMVQPGSIGWMFNVPVPNLPSVKSVPTGQGPASQRKATSAAGRRDEGTSELSLRSERKATSAAGRRESGQWDKVLLNANTTSAAGRQVNEQIQRKLDELLEALGDLEGVDDIITNL